jgi:hypothetical protein
MTFDAEIKSLCERFLGNVRQPDVTGLVDSLFHAASQRGGIAGTLEGDSALRFSVCRAPALVSVLLRQPAPARSECTVEHPAARAILRMICARLAVVCKERSLADVSPYELAAEFDYPIADPGRWSISVVNTPACHRFQIEPLDSPDPTGRQLERPQ